MAKDIISVLKALADRLDYRARSVGGDHDLDDTAWIRAEPIQTVANEVRALAEELELDLQDVKTGAS
jgi:hypothetical protein